VANVAGIPSAGDRTPVAQSIVKHYTDKSKFHSRRNKLRAQEIRGLLATKLSSHLLSEIVKNETHKTIIFPIVLYRCETWSLALREEDSKDAEKNIWT
jgi:hypothetical protein